MSNVNCVFLSGHLTRDAERRYLANGTALLTLSIAVNRDYQQAGEWQRETTYIDCKAWGTTAERSAPNMAKGAEVLINGRLQQEEWQAADGAQRSKLVVVADRIDVVRGGKGTRVATHDDAGDDEDELPF